ncbi:MAG: hypothetical protein Q8P19_04080, partial [bacterium]|nr:hypothetical protein [bacterium]
MPTTVWIDIKPVAAVSETEVSCSIMLPTGKSLEKPTLDLFEAARINIRRPHPRTIRCKVEGLIGVSQAIFCRPDMIGKMVAEGVADFGITGSDVIEE